MTRPRSGWPSPVNADPARGGWPAALMPGRKQGWPRGINTSADPAENLLSQAVGWWDAAWYTPGDRFLRNRGVAGELLDMRLGSSSSVATSNDPLYLAPEATGYCYLPGVANCYLSAPSAAPLDVTGSLDIRVLAALDDWTPGAINILLNKRAGTSSGISYGLNVNTNGTLQFIGSSDGTTLGINTSSSVATGYVDGVPGWVRVTRDGTSGDVTFYTSSDNGATWAQLGSVRTGLSTSALAVTTSAVTIGGVIGSQPLSGKVYRAQVYNGIAGTLVLDVNCDVLTDPSATTFTEQSPNAATVTVGRATSGRKTVAQPARGRGGRACFLLGTDDYFEVQDNWQHQLLNFGQGDSFTVLAVVRKWDTGTAGVMWKRADAAGASTLPGWTFYTSGTSQVFTMADGISNYNASSGTYATGPLQVMVGIEESGTKTLYGYVNSVVGVLRKPTAFPTYTTAPLQVGVAYNSAYINAEMIAIAVVRRALTAAEIKTITDYYIGRRF